VGACRYFLAIHVGSDRRQRTIIQQEQEREMNRSAISLSLVLLLGPALASGAIAQSATPAITEPEARAIGVDAYLYFYPLISTDITRLTSTNIEAGKEPLKGPMNTFVNAAAYPPGDLKLVVRINFDTLYSLAWLDLTKEPDTDGRYFLLPMLDMWTDVFASPGWRTTGTKAQTFLMTPPGWRPDLRDRFIDEFKLPRDTQRIDAPTPYLVIIGRTKTDGPPDYDAVHKIQAGYKVTPLSQWGKSPQPMTVKVDPTIDMKTPPKIQVDAMPANLYFTYAAELLKVNPPHITDQPMIAQLKKIGIEPGKSFDFDKADPAIRNALVSAREDAQKLMEWKTPTIARVANGWSMNTDTMGVYGNYYLKRAIVAQVGLGANLPEDAIYPLNVGDETGKPLDGANKYTLHFDKATTPPVNAFWSVTLYDTEGYQVPNTLNRFAVSGWMPFKYNGDGSLDLYFQNQNPGKEREANWLPAPQGAFNLTMRLYAPKSEALTGKWNPPPIVKAQGTVGQSAQ
jgi:hypothetical protein